MSEGLPNRRYSENKVPSCRASIKACEAPGSGANRMLAERSKRFFAELSGLQGIARYEHSRSQTSCRSRSIKGKVGKRIHAAIRFFYWD